MRQKAITKPSTQTEIHVVALTHVETAVECVLQKAPFHYPRKLNSAMQFSLGSPDIPECLSEKFSFRRVFLSILVERL